MCARSFVCLPGRYGITDVRKFANRMNFNVPEEEYIDGDDVRACLLSGPWP